jgi:hypothetical protein
VLHICFNLTFLKVREKRISGSIELFDFTDISQNIPGFFFVYAILNRLITQIDNIAFQKDSYKYLKKKAFILAFYRRAEESEVEKIKMEAV